MGEQWEGIKYMWAGLRIAMSQWRCIFGHDIVRVSLGDGDHTYMCQRCETEINIPPCNCDRCEEEVSNG